jgi:hypothetical protein
MRLLQSLLSIWSWETIRDTGATIYQVNKVTGKRRAIRSFSGYQPVDNLWLETGEWSEVPLPPEEDPEWRR